MRGHGEKLSRRGEEAVVAILSNPTIAEAARACGVSEASLYRWQKLPSFQERLHRVKKAMVETAMARIQLASMEATETLLRNLNCGQPSVEVRAARALLDLALESSAWEGLDQRLLALEETVKGGSDGSGT